LISACLSFTLGALIFDTSHGQEADNVLSLMKSVRFDVEGSIVTWRGMYLGLGLLFSVFLIFSAFLTWYLGGLDSRDRGTLSPISWALFLCYVLVAILCWVYFFIVPEVVFTLIAVLLGIACIKKVRTKLI
jgi:uncharacterized BrkB/YihY/UPF0761 family membrane protein